MITRYDRITASEFLADYARELIGVDMPDAAQVVTELADKLATFDTPTTADPPADRFMRAALALAEFWQPHDPTPDAYNEHDTLLDGNGSEIAEFRAAALEALGANSTQGAAHALATAPRPPSVDQHSDGAGPAAGDDAVASKLRAVWAALTWDERMRLVREITDDAPNLRAGADLLWESTP